MVMVRGSNPVWSFVDLTGHQFDDTFYMFVLENEIPYAPATVWHDANGNIPWTNPIRFLANGTLPIDIYFDPDTVYRLEFRQGNTQQDPLIYLVENYIPGQQGSGPIDTVALSTDNQMSNPQFAVVNFENPLALINASTQTIEVGPDWFLDLTGTGNVTLTQLPLNSNNNTPTNAPYGLQIELSGTWTEAVLRQRYQQNGVLWANKYVSFSITALRQVSAQSISAQLRDSLGNTLAEVLPTTSLDGNFTEYTGYGDLGDSVNTQNPPAAYIDFRLNLPTVANLIVTSLQLVAGDLPIRYPYEQDTIQRQIDHLYHYAYPIVPVGTVISFYGFGTPTHYLPCNGMILNRVTHSQLFNVLTHLETVTLTGGTPTLTVADGAIYAVGHAVEGPGIPPNTFMVSIVGNTVTLSNNVQLSGPQLIRFFCTGNGDGSTTFNTPSLSGEILAGAYGSLPPLTSSGVGSFGGSATHPISILEMPQHDHPGSVVGASATSPGGSLTLSGSSGAPGFTEAVTVAPQGGGTLNVEGQPMTIVQPTRLAHFVIRYR